MQIVLFQGGKDMITPKIRSFAKLIALLGNDRKEEETSSGMSIHRSIDRSIER